MLEVGQVIIVTATVKDHREFNGIRETHLIRVKPYVSPEEKKRLGKERKAAKAEYERLKEASDAAWEDAREAAPGSPLWETYQTARDAANTAYNAWKAI